MVAKRLAIVVPTGKQKPLLGQASSGSLSF
jgi:hypothetical protein